MFAQRTLARPVELVGVGLHSGQPVRLGLYPSEPDSGLVFVRTDLEPPVTIPAQAHWVQETLMSSSLVQGTARLGTVEHLMAALAACGVDNLRMAVHGAEIPIMDGSAQPFVAAILAAGLQDQPAAKRFIQVLQPVEVRVGDKWARLSPSDRFQLDFCIEFDHPVIAATPQQVHVDFGAADLQQQFCGARTFGFLRDLEHLHAQQLALGGSLDNAIVVGDTRIENPEGLRCADEFVRHKVLDAVGDLYLAGHAILGHYEAHKSGHALNNQLLRALLDQPDLYQWVSFVDENHNPHRYPDSRKIA